MLHKKFFQAQVRWIQLLVVQPNELRPWYKMAVHLYINFEKAAAFCKHF